MRLFQTFALLALVGIVSGCSQTTDTPSVSAETVLTSVNTHCPVMGGKVKPDGGSTTWNDQAVGFCCPECIEKWNELSDEEKQTKLTDADNVHPEGDQDSSDHGHST